jgi:WD40 repeat protein
MYCEISGVAPEDPVVSRRSGHLFERRLILKALASSGGKCPVTGEDLSEDDLIAVRVSGTATRPVPASAVSLPGLLSHMRNEWDAIVLETHSLKQRLAGTRQELAHALYQYDAATRVIARLKKEKEEALASLSSRALAELLPVQKDIILTDKVNGSRSAPLNVKNGPDELLNEGTEVMTSKSNLKEVHNREQVAPKAVDPIAENSSVTNTNSKSQQTPDEAKVSTEAPTSASVHENGSGIDFSEKLPDSMLEHIVTTQASLTTARKARTVPATLATGEDVRLYIETHRCDFVQKEKDIDKPAQFVSAALYIQNTEGEEEANYPGTLAVGCGDGAIRMFSATNLAESGVGAPMAHTGGVAVLTHSDLIHPTLLFSGGRDGIVLGWKLPSLQAVAPPSQTPSASTRSRSSKRRRSSAASAQAPVEATATITIGEAGDSAVTGLALHPAGDLILTSLSSGSWRFHAMEGESLMSTGVAAHSAGIECCAVHPDGGIFGIGTTLGVVEIWDVKQMKRVESLGAGIVTAGGANLICMSENGYYMVVCGRNTVRVWDLRHLKIARETTLVDGGGETVPPSGFALDWSGKYFAAAVGSRLNILETRKLRHVVDLDLGTKGNSIDRLPSVADSMWHRRGVVWGPDARSIFIGLEEGGVKRFAQQNTPKDDEMRDDGE